MKMLPACGVVLWGLCAQGSWADPLNEPAGKDAELAPLLSAHDPASERFFSVGQLRRSVGVGWSCTATLVAGSTRPDPDKPALILTAGHCAAGTTGDNEVVVDHPAALGWYFSPSYFYDNQDQHVRIPVVMIRYSTLKGTDLGVMQLGETYGQMLARGFKPMRVRALDGANPDIDIAHIPRGLFPDQYLRYSECPSRPPAAVYESLEQDEPRPDLPWFWPSASPHSCIGTYGGSSGAPIFARGTREIVGVHSTRSTVDGCGSAAPCEIEEGQSVSRLGTSYFAAVDRLVGAFKPDGAFHLSNADPGTGITLHRKNHEDGRPVEGRASGERSPVRWGMLIDESFANIRYKFDFADQANCEQPKGYGDPEPVLKQPLLDLATPRVPGVYALCAVGQRMQGGPWQPWTQATVKILRVE